MAFATRLPKVRDHSEDFNERTWMCYHQAPPLVRVVAHVGGCRASKAPPQTQPFIASGSLLCNPSTKTECPCGRQLGETIQTACIARWYGMLQGLVAPPTAPHPVSILAPLPPLG